MINPVFFFFSNHLGGPDAFCHESTRDTKSHKI